MKLQLFPGGANAAEGQRPGQGGAVHGLADVCEGHPQAEPDDRLFPLVTDPYFYIFLFKKILKPNHFSCLISNNLSQNRQFF
jgi:hypothetical protein